MIDSGKGYTGSIPSSGAAAVKAPVQKAVKKSVTAHRGEDLRTGKGKK